MSYRRKAFKSKRTFKRTAKHMSRINHAPRGGFRL